MHTDSPYQLACYDFIQNETGSAVIEAVAGSGKTTTGVNMVKRIPRGLTHTFLAFNKSIATELSARGVNGRTFHSMCFGPVLRAKGASNVEANKLRKIIDAALGDDDSRLYGQFITRLVGLARNSGFGCLMGDTTEDFATLAEHHDLELDSERATLPRALELAKWLLDASNASDMVDFDDLLYIAVKDGVSLPKFDVVFVDEAQDTNAIQRALLRKILKPEGRLIAIGDPAQAIYGFRGADSESMRLMAEMFECKHLPLTVSYRCPTAVVEFAQQWADHIEAAPGAQEGTVAELDTKWSNADFRPGDLVVCRTTRPLISLAFSMLKDKKPVRIMGREIGQGLKSLINKMNAKGVDALAEKLTNYTSREAEKAIAQGKDAKAEQIRDKSDAIFCLINGLPETDRTVPALLRCIDELFADVNNATVLATIHKAKGLEADTVFWLNSSQCPSSWARQPWQKQQERNLCYVAATRAKVELVLIEERKDRVTDRESEAA